MLAAPHSSPLLHCCNCTHKYTHTRTHNCSAKLLLLCLVYLIFFRVSYLTCPYCAHCCGYLFLLLLLLLFYIVACIVAIAAPLVPFLSASIFRHDLSVSFKTLSFRRLAHSKPATMIGAHMHTYIGTCIKSVCQGVCVCA